MVPDQTVYLFNNLCSLIVVVGTPTLHFNRSVCDNHLSTATSTASGLQ